MLKDKNQTAIELSKSTNNNITKLVETYRKDKKLARLFFITTGSDYFRQERTVLFFKSNMDFEVVTFVKGYGISKTNIMYSNEKRTNKIIFGKDKFYEVNYVNSKHNVRLLLLDGLTKIHWSLLEKYRPWMLFLKSYVYLAPRMSLNLIFNKKLFSEKKLVQHQLGIPLKVYKRLVNFSLENDDANIVYRPKKVLSDWVPYGLYAIKIFFNSRYSDIRNKHMLAELLIDKEVDPGILVDTIKMSMGTGDVVDLKWSKRRFIEEHNRLSVYTTNTMLELENRNLNPSTVYKLFEEFSGLRVFKTSKEMGLEGLKQKHCVASYCNKVQYGKAGIYHIDGYTLELNQDNKSGKLIIGQIRGVKNCNPPTELTDSIKKLVNEFNLKYLDKLKNNKQLGHPQSDDFLDNLLFDMNDPNEMLINIE